MENDYNDIIYSYNKKVDENVLDRSIAHDRLHGEQMTWKYEQVTNQSTFSAAV